MIIMYTNPGVTRTTFVLFGFSYLAVGRSYWRLFKKRVVQTKLDIYVFMFTCDILIFCLDTTCTRKTVSDCCGRLPMMMSEGKASKFEFIYLRIFLCGDKNYNNYSNILIISWQSAIPEENHRLATSLCQSLSHTVVSSTPHHVKEYNSQCVLITLLEESPITFIPEVHMSCIVHLIMKNYSEDFWMFFDCGRF